MSAPRHPFWVWSPYAGEPGLAFVTQIAGLRDAPTRQLLGGEPLARLPRLTVRRCTPGEFTDVLGSYMGLLLLSPVLVEVLRAAGARLQLMPISIPGRPDLQYVIANVLDRVPAIDLARSTLTTYEGTDVIARVSHLALSPIAPDAPPIFHAAEHLVLVLVNDDLRQRLQAASTHPGVLTPLEKWRNDR